MFLPILLAVLGAWVALDLFDPKLAKEILDDVESAFEGLEGSATKGALGPAFGYWVIGSVIVVAGGFGIWYAETKVAKKEGYNVAPPPVAPISIPAPPQPTASSGFSVGPGGVGIQQGTGFGASPSTPPVIVQSGNTATPIRKEPSSRGRAAASRRAPRGRGGRGGSTAPEEAA